MKKYISYNKIQTAYKKCMCCKKEYPKNEKYFHVKKSKSKSGDSVYFGYRSNCKKCHSKKKTLLNRLKKCKELGCALSDYEKTWKKDLYNKLTKHKQIHSLQIPLSKKMTIIKKIRKGYKFVSYEKYIQDAKNELRKSLEKRSIYEDLPNGYTFWKEVPIDLRKKILNNRITNSKLANWIGIKVSEATPEMLQTKKILVEMNRYIKSV